MWMLATCAQPNPRPLEQHSGCWLHVPSLILDHWEQHSGTCAQPNPRPLEQHSGCLLHVPSLILDHWEQQVDVCYMCPA